MVNVSEELKTAFLSGRQKNLTLKFYKNGQLVDTLGTESIVLESMEIEQLLCSEAQLTFGLCNAASFKVDIFNGSVTHKDLIVKPEISALDDENTEHTFNLGVYKVVEDVVSDDRNTRTLTAYDALYDVVNNDYSDWYKNLNMPMTLKQFRNAFFSHIGITQVDIDLPNDNMQIQKTIDTNNLSGSMILKAILELNASFGFINYEGKFVYTLWKEGVGLFPAVDLYPSEDLYPVGVAAAKFGTTEESEVILDSLVYADYTVAEITGVKFQTTSTDEGTVVGSDGNIYQILSNFLLYDKSAADLQTIGNNFLEYADQLYYRPAKFQVRSHPWIELGDFVSVNAKSFRVTMPVLKRTISGITALYDDYEAQGSEKYTAQANNLYQMTENLYRKTLEIIKNTDEVSTTLHEEDVAMKQEYTSMIQQTSRQIVMKVNNNGKIVQVQLGVDPNDGSATIFDVKAGNISMTAEQAINFMAGGDINLNSKGITITSEKFSVDRDGNASFSGNISASNITGSSLSTTAKNNPSGTKMYLKLSEGYLYAYKDGNSTPVASIFAVNDSSHTGFTLSNCDLYKFTQNGSVLTYDQFLTSSLADGRYAKFSQIWGSLSIMGDYYNSYQGVKIYGFKNREDDSYNAKYTLLTGEVFSDERVKRNIKDIEDDFLDLYENLSPKEYQYLPENRQFNTKEDTEFYGFVAQDIIKLFGENNKDYDCIVRKFYINEEEWRYQISYDYFHALHVKYAHHLKDRIDELEQKNSELEERIARLEALIGDK